MNYQSKIKLITNSLITEYDIRQGNISVMKAFQLVSDEKIASLKKLPKDQRVREVGLMMRDDKEFAERLERGFDEIVHQFIQKNELDMDVDITDIRRDAVFVVTKHPTHCTLGNGAVVFRPKGEYHAMIRINPMVTAFFRSNRKEDEPHVEVHGIVRRGSTEYQELSKKLENGPFAFLEEFVGICEASGSNKTKIYEWIKEFCLLYKQKALDLEYYREFNREGGFRLRMGNDITIRDTISETDLEDLDISYNYRNLIVPILQIIV